MSTKLSCCRCQQGTICDSCAAQIIVTREQQAGLIPLTPETAAALHLHWNQHDSEQQINKVNAWFDTLEQKQHSIGGGKR